MLHVQRDLIDVSLKRSVSQPFFAHAQPNHP